MLAREGTEKRESLCQRKGDFTHINRRIFILKEWKYYVHTNSAHRCLRSVHNHQVKQPDTLTEHMQITAARAQPHAGMDALGTEGVHAGLKQQHGGPQRLSTGNGEGHNRTFHHIPCVSHSVGQKKKKGKEMENKSLPANG